MHAENRHTSVRHITVGEQGEPSVHVGTTDQPADLGRCGVGAIQTWEPGFAGHTDGVGQHDEVGVFVGRDPQQGMPGGSIGFIRDLRCGNVRCTKCHPWKHTSEERHRRSMLQLLAAADDAPPRTADEHVGGQRAPDVSR